jgi:hypothetical protein
LDETFLKEMRLVFYGYIIDEIYNIPGVDVNKYIVLPFSGEDGILSS